MDKILVEKYNKLLSDLRGYGKVAVAFSAGVDSTLLLAAAKEALGDDCMAISLSLHSTPVRDKEEAEAFCKKMGINLVSLSLNELSIPGFKENPPDRCYICKKALFTQMREVVKERGFSVLVEGSNMDDLSDYRPGARAIKELGIVSPLRDAGLYKAEIRAILKSKDIPVWKKPSAACLSSRFAYGEEITAEKLHMVDQAENLLHDLGFMQCRVRMHGMMARIEVQPSDIEAFVKVEVREKVSDTFRGLGFTYVTMDLMGYRMGSMNEILKKTNKN